LFNVFINDITKHFENNKSTPLKLIDSNISCLLFADDLLILSETKEGLQHRLNNPSANKRQLMFESISFKGVDLLFSKFLVISLINTLNNVGFHESPCLTPLEMSKKTEC
jgi:ATP/ADP translocase